MKNLTLVINLISEIKETNKNIKKAKTEKIKFYENLEDRVNALSWDRIKDHDFNSEIIGASLTIQKLDYFKTYKYKLMDKLETHRYSPEQNRLYFRNGTSYISVPNKTEIYSAISHIITTQSFDQIKSI